MSTPPPAPETPPVRAIDRFLAFGSLGVAAASVLCFFAIIIGTATGMHHEDFSVGAWPLIAAIPLWGLPVAFLMIIVLLVMSFVRKGRAARR